MQRMVQTSVYTLRGLPRFFLTGGSEVDAAGAAEEDEAPDFLFLLPLGRPRLLLAGGIGSLVLGSATAGWREARYDQHARLAVAGTDGTSPLPLRSADHCQEHLRRIWGHHHLGEGNGT